MGLLPTSIAESMDQPAVTPNPQYQEVVLPGTLNDFWGDDFISEYDSSSEDESDSIYWDSLADFWDDEYIAESDSSSEDESDSIYWDSQTASTPNPQYQEVVLDGLDDFWDDEYIAESDPSFGDESDSIYWDNQVVATPHPQLDAIVLPSEVPTPQPTVTSTAVPTAKPTQAVTAAPQAETSYDEIMNALISTSSEAEAFRKSLSSESNASTVWQSISGQAISKLQDAGFVYVNETLNTYSDMLGSITSAVFDDETWEDQQVALWEQLISDAILQNVQSVHTGKADEYADLLNFVGNGMGVVEDVSEWIMDHSSSTMAYLQLNLDDLVARIENLSMEIDHASKNWDFDSVSQMNDQKDLFQDLKEQLQDLKEQQQHAHTASESAATNSKALGILMTGMQAFCEGTAAKDAVTQRNAQLIQLLSEGEVATQMLNDFLLYAASTNNEELAKAAVSLERKMEEKRNSVITDFAEENAAFMEGAMGVIFEYACEEVLTSDAFYAGIDQTISHFMQDGTSTFAKTAGQGIGQAMAILGAIEFTAGALNYSLNWGPAYKTAHELMTYSVMDHQLGVLHATPEQAESIKLLWSELQKKGADTAVDFICQYDAGNGLDVDDVIGSNDLSDVIGLLYKEKCILQEAAVNSSK